LDGRFCNKIGQLPYLADIPADFYALCDTDLAFLEKLDETVYTDTVRAKIVDYQVPTLQELRSLAQVAGLPLAPRLVQTTCDQLPTFSTNCNGGLYVVARSVARRLGEAWYKYAAFARSQTSILRQSIRHADQIGFSLAVLAMGWDVDELAVEWNFPMHVPRSFGNFAFSRPKILHYHGRLSKVGLLLPTGNELVDESISAVNGRISAYEEAIALSPPDA
jgi:hypothetical protein